ncbi:S-adenosyl-L-methionine-dependent methyltransferase [Cunninghamella echinulata]|nr:S-adenosyl-L-methionine-dependent methyltransferase [Cunninghamella echinulata]
MEESIKYLRYKPFFNYLTNIIDTNFFTPGSNDKAIHILEIGCGQGFLGTLLKDRYKDKINLTGIDPFEKDLELAKQKSKNIRFAPLGILEWQQQYPDEKFDLVFFSKSLHHCPELEKSIQTAYDLVNPHGILIAEEIDPQYLDDDSIYWFLDRLDLLTTSGLVNIAHNPIEADYERGQVEKVSDIKQDAIKRWRNFVPCHDVHQPQQVKDAFKKIIGENNIIIENPLPFFSFLLVFFGLIDNSTGKAVYEQFLAQEQRDLDASKIKTLAYNIVVKK